MFGFLQPDPRDARYRRLYAGCCSFQHRQFGLATLPLLSYEGVFLYVLAADAGACTPPDDSAATCCRLRKASPRLYEVDKRLAMFCTSFGLLLVSVKLEDDIRDDGSLPARFALWRLRSRIDRARLFFEELDPRFRERTGRFVEEHLELERGGRRPTLEEYARPTAEAFAYLFGLYAKVLPTKAMSEPLVRDIGAAVGQAIISFDCAVDWERDRRRGRFNPLPDRGAVAPALLESARWLSHAGWQCCEALGPQSHAAAVAGATFRRVQNRIGGVDSGFQAPPPRRRRWRAFRRRGDCDCFCDPSCCDGCGACDCPTGSDATFDACICCCPDCGGCCDCGSQKSRKGKGDVKQSPVVKLQGLRARTVGPLKPSGIVQLGDERLPARSEFGWIDGDAEVEIIRDEPFGVVVRPVCGSDPRGAG